MILLKTKRSQPKNKAILERNWHKLVDKLKVMITDAQELFIKWTKISESGWRRISTTLDCPGRLPVTPIKPMMIWIWLRLSAKQLVMVRPNGSQLLPKHNISSEIQRRLGLMSYHQTSIGKTWMATILSAIILTREGVVLVMLLQAQQCLNPESWYTMVRSTTYLLSSQCNATSWMRDVTEVGVSLTASSWSSFTQSVAMMQATKVM